MPVRPARLVVLLTVPLLLLGACGDDTGSDTPEGAQGLAAVTISGDVGDEPKVTWKDRMTADRLDSEVLVEGDGAAVEDGQQVFARLWVGNGYSKTTALSNYGKDSAPELLTVGNDLSPAIKAAVQDQTLGSRVAVAAPPKDAFGEGGNAQLGIGNTDSVLFIVDLIGVLPDGPSGTDQKPSSWAPAVDGDQDPTALDFKGTPKPTAKLRLTTLIKGDGEATEKGQTIYVDYLGQVYDGKQPFDASYARGEPFSFPLGGGQVIKGWDQALEGVPTGSRVLIAVPPKLGYGEAGNPDAGIKGTDALYFVIDVLAAV
ncbi:MAG: FKBP-type peptidyl-prolyl cis-trans isomerase [Nocardioides sp.]